jgi:hypothetical protein
VRRLRLPWSTSAAGAFLVLAGSAWLLAGPERDAGACAPESIGVVPAIVVQVLGLALFIYGGSRHARTTRSVLGTVVASIVLLVIGAGALVIGTLLDGFCF